MPARTLLPWVALCAALALPLSACESDDGDATSDATPDATADTSTTSDTTTATGDGEPAPMAGITAAHNAVRQGVGAGLPDLVWDAEVAAFAQQWADELATRDCDLEHRPRTGEFAQQHGENLFWGSGNRWTVQDVVDSWASEVQFYDYDANSCSGVCGHYTQIVWKDSTRLGCARASCGESQVWVCNYDPPGNYIGQRPY